MTVLSLCYNLGGVAVNVFQFQKIHYCFWVVAVADVVILGGSNIVVVAYAVYAIK
jgi:hypothetical protein